MAAYETLNKEQLNAIVHGDGPLLIIAGAGTGKTTVITERIKHLILEKNVPQEKILALTFTEKATLEMQERIDISMPYGYYNMWIHTFHSFCDRVLRENAQYIGIDPGYKLLTDLESLYFLHTHIFDLGLKTFKPIGRPTKFLEGLLTHFSRLSDEDITPSQYESWVDSEIKRMTIEKNIDRHEELEQYKELAKANSLYAELKAKENVMDFGDLISNTLKLFRTRNYVLKKYQDMFDYVLVDEFQDTNYAQNELSILLAGSKRNITVVADDDQSIYRFRGAAISNVLQFRKRFPDAKAISLIENYRSTQIILDSAYSLIQHNNPNRLEVTEHINKKLKSNTENPNRAIEFIHTTSSILEAKEIVKKLIKLTKSSYTYKDIAILVRANSHAREIVTELKLEKIPYQFLGPEFLFQQEEIKDLIAYLFFLTNLSDSASLYRILSMNVFDIKAIELHHLLNSAKKNDQTLFEAITKSDQEFLSEETKTKFKRFIEMVNNHLEIAKRSNAWTILYHFLNDSTLLTTLKDIRSVDDEKRTHNIIKFFDRVKKFETGRTNANIYILAEWIGLMLTLGDSLKTQEADMSSEDAVNILTIHSSKGLEFKVVFLINLVSERFPTRERAEQIPLPEGILKENLPIGVDYHLEEERRLFYVGITRAKEQLIFSAANFYGEGKRIKKLSPFIFESAADIVDKVTETKGTQINLESALLNTETLKMVAKSNPYKVKYITFSNLQLFDICPLHYKAKVILNIPTLPTANQSSGISIHKTLQKFYTKIKEGERMSKDELLAILETEWINEGYVSVLENKEAFSNAKSILEKFYDNEFDPNVKPLALELQFDFFLKNGVKASGTIDRIDRTPNGIEIIDYKTGEYNEKAKKPHEEQLALYALAATRIKSPLFHYQPEDITLTIHFLKGNVKKTIHLTQADLEKYETKLISTIEAIENSDFVCSGKLNCQNCEYKMLCQTVTR